MEFSEVFKNQFYDRMLKPGSSNSPIRNRADSFLEVFTRLEQKKDKNFTIVETGCMRRDHGEMCFGDDGCSTYLFDQFVNHYNGIVYSVDISEANCNYARSKISNKTEITCSDSVKFLWNFAKTIDLLYLDSFDIRRATPHPSQLHHLKELCAATKNLRRGSIVVVDDHDAFFTGGQIGKGVYIKDFMYDIGVEMIFEGYQIGWQI